jgi:galactokinase
VPPERSGAFAPGRVNLIGEHTDYNLGLALPFAIAEGVTVRAEAAPRGSPGAGLVDAYARDLDERDEFALAEPTPAPGWRAFVRGVVAELARAGVPLVGARLELGGDLPLGAGLSSSAALAIALCLALADLGRAAGRPGRGGGGGGGGRGEDGGCGAGGGGACGEGRGGGGEGHGGGVKGGGAKVMDRTELALLCARVEHDWVGAHTGLLDPLASLYGAPDAALCIDFRTLGVEPVPLRLGGWRLVVLDSGERHRHASSGYNARRAECARACRLLGVASLREATRSAVELLPEPLRRRALHVLDENARVRRAVAALRVDDLPAIGRLLDASHESLRERFEVSTPAVEAAVERLRGAGAAGARVVGGGFGGSVLGLFAPGVAPPAGARVVRPAAGARLLRL